MIALAACYCLLLVLAIPLSVWLDSREKRAHHPATDLREVYRERVPGAEALRRARGER